MEQPFEAGALRWHLREEDPPRRRKQRFCATVSLAVSEPGAWTKIVLSCNRVREHAS